MPDEPALLDGVRKYLERGGYILEMQVAQTIQRVHPSSYVQQGYRYVDPLTGKEREGDVDATLFVGRVSEPGHSLRLAIECKRTDAPWIAFYGDGAWYDSLIRVDGVRHSKCGYCRTIAQHVRAPADGRKHAYAIVEKRNEDKQGQDHAYQAVQQAATALMSLVPGPASARRPDNPVEFGQPIVVTTSRLITCELDANGDASLAEVDSLSVLVERTRHAPDVRKAQLDAIGVTVVRADALEQVLSQSLDLLRGRENFLG